MQQLDISTLSNYERYYKSNTTIESLIMVVISVLTNLVSLPLCFKIYRQNRKFISIILGCAIFTSFFYHLGEIYDWQIFLKYHEWHRLDNIFSNSSFSLFLLYLTGTRSETLEYFTLIIAILCQEKDPWNINYTIAPIAFFFIVGLIYNFMKKRGMPTFNKNKLAKGLILLLIGLYFFNKGLNEETDYLRINHGLWHLFLGLSSWYNLQCIKEKNQEFISLQE